MRHSSLVSEIRPEFPSKMPLEISPETSTSFQYISTVVLTWFSLEIPSRCYSLENPFGISLRIMSKVFSTNSLKTPPWILS